MSAASSPAAMHPGLLAIHRVLAGLSREQLAERSRLPTHEIAALEKGGATAHPLIVRKLARGLRVPVDYLVSQPIEPELLDQLLAGEISYKEFRGRTSGLVGARRLVGRQASGFGGGRGSGDGAGGEAEDGAATRASAAASRPGPTCGCGEWS